MTSVHSAAYRKFLVKLRQARTDAGLTQVEAASKLRKTQAFVSKSERGERRVDVVELQQFAKLYGVSLGWFVAEAD